VAEALTDRGLVAVSVAAALPLLADTAGVPVPVAVRVVAGCAVVLLLPGLLVLRAARVRRDLAEQLTLAVAGSIGGTIAVGLLADRLGLPLTTDVWSILLSGVVLAAGLLVLLLPRPAAGAGGARPAFDPLVATVLGAVVVLVLVAGGVSAESGRRADEVAATTQLSVQSTRPRTTTVTIVNGEPSRTTWTIVRAVEGGPTESLPVDLAPGETWQELLPLPEGVAPRPPGGTGPVRRTAVRVRVQLRDATGVPRRSVQLLVSVRDT
jgi:hypothetical protein